MKNRILVLSLLLPTAVFAETIHPLPLDVKLEKIQATIKGQILENGVDPGVVSFSILSFHVDGNLSSKVLENYAQTMHFYSSIDPASNEKPSFSREELFQGQFIIHSSLSEVLMQTSAGALLREYLHSTSPHANWRQLGYQMTDGFWQSESGTLLYSPSESRLFRVVLNAIP